ncbi:uncharacterized protein LOC126727650 isoform X2 [Quercus robur]|uniref:uncharacterized protein LOC126727650 isoform X2 n=1 Tax=Quercus robur TaxID=38942 RepID=UPI0021619170|nr:uncharacterized protein LOC126727650 isoform X2 [Quercus robur]XP_050289486.1 uncharacterized protein LOC126727650 isoform X2 [Quercus robur]
MAAATASHLLMPPIRCADSKPTRRGFGTKNNTNKVPTKSTTKQSGPVPTQAPGLSSQFDGKSKNNSLDLQFEERLEAVRRSALEKKKEDDEKDFGAIDYDAPVEAEKKTIGLGTQIGVGVAVLVFGLVFALGDFLPSGSVSPTEDGAVVNNKLSEEEKATLQTRLKDYEATLTNSPKDPIALEGAAVTLTELGEYTRAVSVLQDLTKVKPSDPDVYRLLGEVKYELKDYDGSVAAFKISDMVSKEINFEVLRGLTTSLLAAKKPDEVCHHAIRLFNFSWALVNDCILRTLIVRLKRQIRNRWTLFKLNYFLVKHIQIGAISVMLYLFTTASSLVTQMTSVVT